MTGSHDSGYTAPEFALHSAAMSLLTLALIGATIIVSSFLSGVFGMAGGMVLLGVLLVFLDVATAMILFSIIQFFANGWRAVQWWQLRALARSSGSTAWAPWWRSQLHAGGRVRARQGAGLSPARR